MNEIGKKFTKYIVCIAEGVCGTFITWQSSDSAEMHH